MAQSKELVKENSNYVNEIQSLDREKQEVRRTEDRILVTEHSLEELELRIRVVVRYMSDV